MNRPPSDWNHSVLSNPDGGNVFQSSEFALHKQKHGWKAHFFADGPISTMVLERSAWPLGKLWYIPKGPGVTTLKQLDDMFPQIEREAKRRGVFAVKMEPELAYTKATYDHLHSAGLAPVHAIQPNINTVLIDLKPSLDDILASLNQKGRHAIRRAERDGVTVEKVKANDKNCHVMFQLLKDTASGAGFNIRPYDYYRGFWQTYESAGFGQLFFAYFEGKVVAGAYAMVFGKKSIYKDGASIRKRTAYGASHLLQWHVIQWAKEKGSLVHDLCGAPPKSQVKNPHHPYYGIGLFKTSFNKEITEYVGAFDLIVSPLKYKLWRTILERLTIRFWRRFHHDNWY